MLTPRKVVLEFPINLEGQTYTELVFARKTRMRDLIAMGEKDNPLEKKCAFFASLAGVSLDVMLEATQQDMTNIAEAINDLVGESREP